MRHHCDDALPDTPSMIVAMLSLALLSDISDRVDRPRELNLNVGAEVSTWSYNLGSTQIMAPYIPSFALHATGRPLAKLGADWLVVDVEGGLGFAEFTFDGDGLNLAPNRFVALRPRAAAHASLAFEVLANVVVTPRIGLRYSGQSVEAQVIQVGGDVESFTLVPGYTLTAGGVGVGVAYDDDRFLVGANVDLLPSTYYAEQPDNPGQTSSAAAWSAATFARLILSAPLSVELRLRSEGAVVRYEGQGSRRAFAGNELVPLEGGEVVNHTVAGSLAVGLAF